MNMHLQNKFDHKIVIHRLKYNIFKIRVNVAVIE